MTKRHIAQSGTSQGSWVTCNATQQCRNGGMHVEVAELQRAKAWLGHQNINKELSNITVADIDNLRASGYDGSNEAILRAKKSVAKRTTEDFNHIRATEDSWTKVKAEAKKLGAEITGTKVYGANGRLLGVDNVEIEGVQYDVMRLKMMISSSDQKISA